MEFDVELPRRTIGVDPLLRQRDESSYVTGAKLVIDGGYLAQ